MRKVKKQEENFIASPYQGRIFDEVKNGVSNILVEACAGSGKTTTILKSLAFIPNEKKVLMVAFNKGIVSHIKKSINEARDNVEVRTLHALGYDMLRRYYGDDIRLENYKYNKRLTAFFGSYYGRSRSEISDRRYKQAYGNILQLCNLARCYMHDGESGLHVINEKYDICASEDEMTAAKKLMKWGMQELDEIDFTDMIWLPNVLDIKNESKRYDYIFVDECQDLNASQRNLVLKCLADEGRFIAVGDKDQSIYSFSGADSESFKILANTPNTVKLPLSISYRCAKEIVDYAKNFSHNIEVNPANKTKGIIERDCDDNNFEDDALILCRNNAPLAELYTQILSSGKKCHIKGKDIGENMNNLLKTTDEEMLNVNLRHYGVFHDLYKELINMKNRMVRSSGLSEAEVVMSAPVQNRYDMIKTLAILSNTCTTKRQLARKISEVFSDEGQGIVLSTIHKAKGLEAECVYILKKSLLPSPYATKEWQLQEERHLQYVAYTRAKRKLAFLKENDNKEGTVTPDQMVEKFNRIEAKLRECR